MSGQPIEPSPALPSRVRDLTGQTVGRWSVLRYVGHVRHGVQYSAAWQCRCSCGTERVILAQSLNQGRSRSCGCLRDEMIGARRRTHGMFRSPEYVAWMNMKKRCLDATYRRYPGYGGRGIKVCERWLGEGGFANFIADVGPRPSGKHSIERKDNDGDYTPQNVTWSLRHAQDRNKRTSRYLTYDGETLILRDWSSRTGIDYGTLRNRLKKGWSAEKALTTPPGPSGRRYDK